MGDDICIHIADGNFINQWGKDNLIEKWTKVIQKSNKSQTKVLYRKGKINYPQEEAILGLVH